MMEESRFEHIPKDKRKKILLLSDDIRMVSGVGVMSREIVLKTAHRYNWAQVGAAVQHPEQGKLFDMSDAVNQETGLTDANVKLYPFTGYGNPEFLRWLLANDTPDAILHFTDPRFWGWLYTMEHEVREQCPIFFYHIWDDTPYPKYNENFYRSCDWIACISKQTYNIVQQVWRNGKDKGKVAKWQVKYIPHGIPPQVFRKLNSNDPMIKELRRKFKISKKKVDFVVFWNNRNIRRKMPSDVILAYKHFTNQLTKEEASRCRLLMHTAPIDENGTDLIAVIRDVAPECKVLFSTDKISSPTLNALYNIADITINIASNEGFGISTLESMMAETPFITNVTGGLQYQFGFVDKNGNYLHPDRHFNAEFGTNAEGKYKKHGEWVLPVFPAQRALIGSPQTPYIFDDRCDWKEAGDNMMKFYKMTPEERARRGKLGREFSMNDADFTSQKMGDLFIEGMDEALKKWKRPPRYRMVKV
jgi:hypothetical protein